MDTPACNPSSPIASGAQPPLTIEMINDLAKHHWTSPRRLMEELELRFPSLPAIDGHAPVNHVLLFFHALGVGGGELVTCSLARLWQSMGIKVTIATDVSIDESQPAQALPEGIDHIVIPDYNKLTGTTYRERSEALSHVLEERNIDTMVFAHWFAESLPYDLLVCKTYEVKTYIFIQSLFSLFFLDNASSYLPEMPECYRLANAVICLSETDRFVWSQFNQNSFATNNPITLEVPEVPAPLYDHTVIWPARLHPDKCPERVIPIMRELLHHVPDAQLLMVGPVDDAYATHFLKLARQAGVESHIELCGAQAPENMAAFYEKSDAFLLTSRREGWSLALGEALAYGLPCVMYDLPYLTLANNNPAVISIPQNDVHAMAEALAKVLIDKNRARRMGVEGRAFIGNIANYDYRGFWSNLFANKLKQSPAFSDGLPSQIAIMEAFAAHQEYMVLHHTICHDKDMHISNLSNEIADLRRQREQLQNDLNAIVGSTSFRIGRGITGAPRKMRDLLKRMCE